MSSIVIKGARVLARLVLPLVFASLLASCVYRFSNTALRTPPGIRTIAVEAVYDTSREVVPHELLWSAVQREIARSGRLLLSPQSEADALLTLWLTSAKVAPSGTPSREPLAKDPVVTDEFKGRPEDFRNLRRAGSWTTDESVSLVVEVEVHDLKSRKILFKQSYSLGGTFKSLRPVTVTPTDSAYLHYEEALYARVRDLSEQLAQRVVSDFLL
jgi:hypothetical protein